MSAMSERLQLEHLRQRLQQLKYKRHTLKDPHNKPPEVRRAEVMVAKWARASAKRREARNKRFDLALDQINEAIAFKRFPEALKLIKKVEVTRW
jgi:hypothetical protein